jgi:hypothetical protein
MTIREEELWHMHGHTQEAKAAACADGPDDLDAMLFIQFEDGCSYVGQRRHGNETIGMGVGQSMVALWLEHGRDPFKRIFLVLEGHAKTGVPEAELADYQRGDLARMYADDPASDIVELVITSCFEWEDDKLQTSLILHPYHYDDGGVLVWDEPSYASEDQQGLIAESIGGAWRHTRHG